ncbi:M56 family metallopeptidase [Cellulosilyticum lentocellum]|uniref:Peptidase M56 BlaR1 n=1 Tax=Cellulosilyticum lentocellum (strain ATCC 49066 / DSM 5427 / NCIMB 11756 / RHM5) TaxID=642492 RepID=F2JJM1_CELLD|nr:M56 family metallopeptidase [Cellulosilyticum lentocellum]ADZ82063.1 peptidase M56 BlaR1 [Cellulosilyticum lentocellum DSM 5427]
MEIAILSQWLVSVFVMSTVTAAVIILARILIGKNLSPKFKYYLWGIFLLRLMMVQFPESSLSIFNLLGNEASSIYLQGKEEKALVEEGMQLTTMTGQMKDEMGSSTNNPVTHDQGPLFPDKDSSNNSKDKLADGKATSTYDLEALSDVFFHISDLSKAFEQDENQLVAVNAPEESNSKIVIVIYVLGCILCFAYMLMGYISFCYKSRRLLPINDEKLLMLVEQIKKDLHIKKKIALVYGENTCIAGIFKPILILKAGYSEEEYRAILTHELIHYRYGDLLVNWCLVLLQGLYWFNPVVYFVFKQIRQDQEILCDVRVLEKTNMSRVSYSEVLFKEATMMRGSIGAIAFARKESTTKKRIEVIAKGKKLSKVGIVLGVGLVVIIGGICLTNPNTLGANKQDTINQDAKNGAIKNQDYNKQQAISEGAKDATNQQENSDAPIGNSSEVVSEIEQYRDPIDIKNIQVASIKNKELANLITSLIDTTRIEVSYDYFNNFEADYIPATITDERHIQLVLALLARSDTSTISEKDMSGNSVKNQTIVFYQKDEKLAELYINYDTLYDQGWIQYGEYRFQLDEMLFRLLAATEEYRPEGSRIPEDVIELFGKYGYTPAFLMGSSERRLPKTLEVTSADDIENLYFALSIEMSKAIGLDYGEQLGDVGVLGKSITAEIYYLVESLPESDRPISDARGIVIRHEGKIVGAHMDSGRHSAVFYTLSGKSFDEVTSLTPVDYLAETVMADFERGGYSSDEELIATYFKALVDGDTKTYFKTVSTNTWLVILFTNMDNTTLFNEGTVRQLMNTFYKKVDILDIKLSKENDKLSSNRTKIYTVNYRIETNDTSILQNGEYPRMVILTNENGKWLVAGDGF